MLIIYMYVNIERCRYMYMYNNFKDITTVKVKYTCRLSQAPFEAERCVLILQEVCFTQEQVMAF